MIEKMNVCWSTFLYYMCSVKYYVNIDYDKLKCVLEFPWWSRGLDFTLSLLRAQIQSLVRKIQSHKLAVRQKKKKKKKERKNLDVVCSKCIQ